MTRSCIINPIYHLISLNLWMSSSVVYQDCYGILTSFDVGHLLMQSFTQLGNQIVRAISSPWVQCWTQIPTQWSNMNNLASSNFFFLHYYYLSPLKLITKHISLISIYINWKNHMAFLIDGPSLCSSHIVLTLLGLLGSSSVIGLEEKIWGKGQYLARQLLQRMLLWFLQAKTGLNSSD